MQQVKTSANFWAHSWKGLVFLAVGLLFFGWLLNTPEGVLGKADAIGYAVCHRIDARSFHLGDRQFPLCVRCSGMYLGAMLGLVFLAVKSPRRAGMPVKSVSIVLGLLALAFALDGANSYFSLIPGAPSLYQPQNWLRMVTGTGMGLVMAAVLYPAFNQTVWREWDLRPALDGLGSFAGMLALAAGMAGLALSESPLILYPLALVSAGGVLVLLTLVYTLVCLMVFRFENRFLNPGQLLVPLAGGFGIGLLQIVVFDLVRYLFTGTWDGFHLG